jgi:hypothetical protein
MRIGISILLIAILMVSSTAMAYQVNDDRARMPVTIHWTAPEDGAPIYQYNVFISLDGGAFKWVGVEQDTTCELLFLEDVEYQVRVSSVSITGLEGDFSETSDVVFIPAGTSDADAPPPVTDIRPNYPNPFNPQTTISYGVPISAGAGAKTSLSVYNLRGQRVKTFSTEQSPGWHSVIWYGDDDQGVPQASGVYYVRFQCDRDVKTWKMTMVK